VDQPPAAKARKGQSLDVPLRARLQPGYHVNSNDPREEFMIPLKLTWAAAPLEVEAVEYPEPAMERYSFTDDPLAVFTGDFDIRTRFRVPDQAPAGGHNLRGSLRYQACSDKLCLPPKTIPVSLTVSVE